MEQPSETLRMVVENLRTRLQNNSQNVTSYDHLIQFGCTQAPQEAQSFDEFKEHYEQILALLDKIRHENSHIETQLKNLYNEKYNHPTNELKVNWIVTKTTDLKNGFIDILTRFKLIQQNHLSALGSQQYSLEQESWSADGNAESQEKYSVVTRCLERVRTDAYHIELQINEIRDLFVEPLEFDNGLSTVHSQQFDEIIFRENEPNEAQQYETIVRKQRLILILFCAVLLVIVATLLLI